RSGGIAKVVDVEVVRGVFGPSAAVGDVTTKHGHYIATSTENARPETLNTAINRRMTECEARVAQRCRRETDELVVLDGPLRESTRHLAEAVGVVKSHETKYLRVELDRVVAALGDGERTPVFRIEARFGRYSWYLRLPGPPGGPWAGIVRCEASSALDSAAVIALADRIAATLPGFASEPHKDPRAPQNLYPIAGLERQLRRRLGDARVLYRALRVAGTTVSVG
ncbi:MAG: DNA double-strand break repair nuclease NurA, partial [Actinomycetota bacterium]|nr:DNA double-strand break repair nuclease NurA [Actinomycetota bacterium]